MAEVTFELVEESGDIEIRIHDFTAPPIKEPDVKRLFDMSEYRECHFYSENVADIVAALPDTPSDEPIPEPLSFVIAQKRNALLEMELLSNDMELAAHCTMQEGGEGLSLEAIVSQLKSLGVVKGIDKEAIRKFHDRAKNERPGVSFSEVLAEGKPAETGKVSTFECLVTPLEDRVLTPQKREDGTLDMHDLGEISTVKKGDHLMRRTPSSAGENGYTILGEVLVSKVPDNISFDVGDGTSTSPEDGNLLIATRAGVPLKLNNGLSVSEMLLLKNVDLTTGNIEYDGTVMVSGSVKGGMLVQATKDIIVNGFVEGGHLDAGGNIVVQQGVIGRELDDDDAGEQKDHYSSSLIAEKDISARYAQSAYLEAGRNISVVSQLLHCHVKADYGVYVGSKNQKKSKLTGGLVKAGREVFAGEIGSPANAPMTIDFSHRIEFLSQEYKTVKGEHEVKKELIQGLREALEELKVQKPTPELVRHCKKIVNTISIVKEEVVSLNLKEQSLHMELNKLKDKLRVTVYGKLYPGVDFVICEQQHNIIEERGSSVIRFDGPKIIFE